MLEETWKMEFPRRTEMQDGFYPVVHASLPMWDNYPVFFQQTKERRESWPH